MGRKKLPNGEAKKPAFSVKCSAEEKSRYMRAYKLAGAENLSAWVRALLDAESERLEKRKRH